MPLVVLGRGWVVVHATPPVVSRMWVPPPPPPPRMDAHATALQRAMTSHTRKP